MLKFEDIALTPLRLTDRSVMFNWINDRQQVLFNASYKPVSEGQHQDWFEAIQRRNDVAIFGIRLLETDKLIGSCQLHSINYIHRSAELQIRIGDLSERNKGYGTDAIHLLLNFAFKDLNLNRVYLHVFETNERALRFYEKCGFIKEGVLRQAAYIDGHYLNVLVMAILETDWLQVKSMEMEE